jgi:beta-glucosidase
VDADFPDGTGTPNRKGIDFYSRLVDQLLAAGIEPFATLYHWDLPQALQDRGGWQSAEIPIAFGEYAGTVARELGDRIKNVFTINEFHSFVDMGHQGLDVSMGGGKSVHIGLAPGLELSNRDRNQVRHHSVLAHGLAVQAIRANGPSDIKIGFAENMQEPIPAIDTPEHIRAAEAAAREQNAPYMTVMLEGRYTDQYLEQAGADAPRFTEDELRTIASPVDFVGINVYRPSAYIEPSNDTQGYRELPFNESHPKMHSSWHLFDPEVMYWAPRLVHSIWGAKSIYVTENGCAALDVIAPDGRVYDSDRLMFVRTCLGAMQRATAEGVPVHGYFHWSAQDNLEWTAGYGNRFGLIYVDFETQQRIPKLSAQWFREAARQNAVV